MHRPFVLLLLLVATAPLSSACGSHHETRTASPAETRPSEFRLTAGDQVVVLSAADLGLRQSNGNWLVNRNVLTRALEGVGQEVDRAPLSGRIDREARLVVADQPGQTLDLEGAIEVVRDGLLSGDPSIALPVSETFPEAPLPDGLSLETVVAEYQTRYRRYQRSRSHNVELATQALDGAIIPPGEVLSFNTQVGERNRRNGYRMAKVISGGELVNGMGGGVCQVASTLFAAAYQAGFELVEYRPHSRPSSYIPLGLDATVTWPNIDLQLRNPFSVPVFVSATTDEGQVRIELLAAEQAVHVEIDRRVVGRQHFEDRVVIDPSLAPGEEVVTQEGIRGARLIRTRVIRREGEPTTETERVRYPPTDRIIRVSPVDPRAPLADSETAS